MKEFPKTVSGQMNRFPKAAEIDNFHGFLKTVFSCFQKRVCMATNDFGNPFITALAAS
jgi:hypothetical protein